MAISKRLKAIAKYIDGYKTLADIACDHGYLGIYAVEEYNLKEVLLTDINLMPLASAVKNVESKNLSFIPFFPYFLPLCHLFC
jgi:tRNA (adenine22-N1)-methyltransferase